MEADQLPWARKAQEIATTQKLKTSQGKEAATRVPLSIHDFPQCGLTSALPQPACLSSELTLVQADAPRASSNMHTVMMLARSLQD